MRALILASLSVGLASAIGTAPARAETINCSRITSVPAVISTPGVYCLTKNLGTNMPSGNAIDIQANNVVLDLNGFRLTGHNAGLGTATRGVHALNRQNITIRNGTIRGFLVGIFLEGSGGQGNLIEDVRADQNRLAGIAVGGDRNIIRNNQVIATGGSTGAEFAVGIIVDGSGNRVLNNDVMGVFHPTDEAAGISFEGNGNVDSLAVGNRVSDAPGGFFIEGTGKYQGNLTSGVATPYGGGTDAGNNN
jgi:hypothetical protein